MDMTQELPGPPPPAAGSAAGPERG
jgi:hypothetical protein